MSSTSRTRPLLRRVSIAAVTVALLGGAIACSSNDGAREGAQRFLDDIGARNASAAASRTDQPDVAGATVQSAWDGLQAKEFHGSAGAVQVNGDTATVSVKYTWTLRNGKKWTYDGAVSMVKNSALWQVRWTPSDIHPNLGPSQQLSAREIPATEAAVNEQDGSSILVPGTVIRITFDGQAAAQSGAVGDAADQLISALGPAAGGLSAQGLAEKATATTGPIAVATLSQRDFDQISDRLANVPGVRSAQQADLVPTDPGLAPDLMVQIKKRVQGNLSGSDGWRVVTVNANGSDVDVLAEAAPKPASAVSISLSQKAQNAAQRAVGARKDFQAMMVVIQPSTGKILAVAQNELADKSGPLATTGLYPPGSTFKMVTSVAAFSSKLATPNSMVGCPGETVIGERTIPNYNRFSLGTVPLHQAFAASCNTTFARLASEMGPADLAAAARSMGIGPKYQVAGLPTDSGSVPIAPELVARTEDGFGQGKVLTSTFGLALVAATVAHGSTPTPQLILGEPTKVTGPRPAASAAALNSLKPMMREVVTSGTASRIADQGEIFGKTGESEVAEGSHAWFAGYRGDLAFATLVVLGGSSDNAVAVTRDFFAALPPGYGM